MSKAKISHHPNDQPIQQAAYDTCARLRRRADKSEQMQPLYTSSLMTLPWVLLWWLCWSWIGLPVKPP